MRNLLNHEQTTAKAREAKRKIKEQVEEYQKSSVGADSAFVVMETELDISKFSMEETAAHVENLTAELIALWVGIYFVKLSLWLTRDTLAFDTLWSMYCWRSCTRRQTQSLDNLYFWTKSKGLSELDTHIVRLCVSYYLFIMLHLFWIDWFFSWPNGAPVGLTKS